uniref:Uncharacterized protein n=1 Tax=Salvator merianae TaxID=96440 RepID=A0A8D0E221_SALMN
MAWRQDLSNPIPNFNISLHSSVQRPTAERNKAPPMTSGQVKATTLHAQQFLGQHSREETPENLVAAVFAVITANSVTLLSSTPPTL